MGEGWDGGIQTAGISPSPVGEGWDGGIQTAGISPSPVGEGWDGGIQTATNLALYLETPFISGVLKYLKNSPFGCKTMVSSLLVNTF